jgi:hypothetical protein
MRVQVALKLRTQPPHPTLPLRHLLGTQRQQRIRHRVPRVHCNGPLKLLSQCKQRPVDGPLLGLQQLGVQGEMLGLARS